MSGTPVVIILDLDFTLAHFESRYDGIYDVASKYGVLRDVAEQTLREHVDSSEWFDFGRYARSLIHDVKRSAELTHDFEMHFNRDFRTYSDVAECMDQWNRMGIPLFIVTAGAPAFQKKKIDHINLPINGYTVTDITAGKGEAIADIATKFPDNRIVFVDDKSSELLRVWNHPRVNQEALSLFKIDRPDVQEKSWEGDDRRNEFAIIEHLNEIHW